MPEASERLTLELRKAEEQARAAAERGDWTALAAHEETIRDVTDRLAEDALALPGEKH